MPQRKRTPFHRSPASNQSLLRSRARSTYAPGYSWTWRPIPMNVRSLLASGEYSWLFPLTMDFLLRKASYENMRPLVPMFDEASATLCDQGRPTRNGYERMVLDQAVKSLYVMLHARYVVSRHGMIQLRRRVEEGYYGRCPRVLCAGNTLIPMGVYQMTRRCKTVVFCATCCETYESTDAGSRVDGAAFGPTVPLSYFFHFPELKPPMFDENVRMFMDEWGGLTFTNHRESIPGGSRS